MVDLQNTETSHDTRVVREVERAVETAKGKLLINNPFFGLVVCKRVIKYTDSIPTAGIDPRGQIYINPQFAISLSIQQLVFLLAHECMHYILLHSVRRKGRDAMAWNIAGDKVINDTLIRENIGEFIDGGVTQEGAHAMATEDLYNEDDAGADVGGTGHDIGDMAGGMSESDASAIEAEVRMEVAKAAKAAKAMGSMSAGMNRFVDEVINVKTPWYDILIRFMTNRVKNEYRWARPNRRFISSGTYLPGADYNPSMGELVIAVDTSGSIGSEELAQFNGHINKILSACNPSKIHILYCDTSVQKHVEVGGEEDEVRLEAIGGGGTSFSPVFEWADNYDGELDCVVYLTDGYGDQNQFTSSIDTIWLTTGTTDFDWGTVVEFVE